MSDPIDDMDDDALLAMDFALGALDGAVLRSAELRLRRDPAFATDVAQWQIDLGPLNDSIVPVVPPATVWAKVENELFRGPVAVLAPSIVVGASSAALRLWRSLALGTSAVAAIALGLLVTRQTTPPQVVIAAAPAAGPLLATSMAATDAAKAVLITATYDPNRGAVILTPATKKATRGLSPELWVIVGKDKPRSLGLIDLHDPQAHSVPQALRERLTGGATLAISLEPAGGSPTGAPTGPIIATGKLTVI